MEISIDEVPVIEPFEDGYYQIYNDGRKIFRDSSYLSEIEYNMKFKDYGESESKYGIGGGDQGGWMRLEQGENKVRIVSEFVDHGTHWDNQKKRSFVCIGIENGCPYCKKDVEMVEEGAEKRPCKVKVRYLGWVIDRKDGNLKILQAGHQIFKQIGQFAASEEFGFDGVPAYDITITRTGEGLSTEYNVMPNRKDTKLTDDEEALIKELAKDPKEIIEKMKEKQDSPSVAEIEKGIDVDDISFGSDS